MISSVTKPLNNVPVGKLGKPRYGSKSDSLGNPLGAGQLLCTGAAVAISGGINYLQFSNRQSFDLNGNTYSLSDQWSLIAFRQRDADNVQNHFGITLRPGGVSSSSRQDLEDELTGTDLIKTVSFKVSGRGGTYWYRPYDTGHGARNSFYVEDGNSNNWIFFRMLGLPAENDVRFPAFKTASGEIFSPSLSSGDADTTLKITIYV